MLKPDLYELIRRNKLIHRMYKIDGILAEQGHSVLRLPVYHPELNLIKFIWATVKNATGEQNVTFKLDDVKKLTDENFAKITPLYWKKRYDHVKRIEDEFIKNEGILDEGIEIIIYVGNDSDTSSTSSVSSMDADEVGMASGHFTKLDSYAGNSSTDTADEGSFDIVSGLFMTSGVALLSYVSD